MGDNEDIVTIVTKSADQPADSKVAEIQALESPLNVERTPAFDLAPVNKFIESSYERCFNNFKNSISASFRLGKKLETVSQLSDQLAQHVMVVAQQSGRNLRQIPLKSIANQSQRTMAQCQAYARILLSAAQQYGLLEQIPVDASIRLSSLAGLTEIESRLRQRALSIGPAPNAPTQ